MGARPHTPGQGAPRSHLRRNKIISRRDKMKIPKKGDNNRWGREMMGFLSPTFANAPMDLEGKKPSPSTPIYSGEEHGSSTPSPWRLPLPPVTPLPLAGLGKALPRSPLLPPPRRRAAGSPSTSPSPLLDQEGGDVFPNCTCVKHGGAIRSALGSSVIWIATSTTHSTPFS